MAAAALLWVLLYAHLRTGSTLLITEVTTALVAYGAARWGRTVTVWFSGLSILALGVLGVWLVGTRLDIVLPLVPLVDAATLKRCLLYTSRCV